MIKTMTLLEAIEKQLLNFEVNNAVFMVGAGVSVAPPTCLPGGKALTWYCMEKELGEVCAKRIHEVWCSVLELLPKHNAMDYECLRLEVFLDNINKNERLFVGTTPNFLYGFLGFSEQHYNENHYLLAQCVDRGSICLTMNFDTCIENVWHISLAVDSKYQYPYVCKENKNGIYHLHGVASVGEALEYSMGATLESVKSGIDPMFSTYLESKLLKDKWMIFIGYSGSDYFDADPFFSGIKSEANAIFFLHGTPGDSEINKAKKHLAGFKEAYVVTGDTTSFLRFLYCKDINRSFKERLRCERAHALNWKEYFERIIHDRGIDQEFVRMQNTIRVANQLGISLDVIEPQYRSKLEQVIDKIQTYNISDIFGCQTDMSATIISDINSTISKMLAKETPDGEGLEIKMRGINARIHEARRNIMSPARVSQDISLQKLYRIVEKGEVSPNNFNSATVYAMNRHVKIWIRDWLNHGRTEENLNELIRLQAGIERMLQMPFNQYMYISYYITLLKLDNLLKAILNPNRNNTVREEQMLELALEINSITQIIKIYINYCRKELILFKIDENVVHFEIARKHWDIANKISEIVGNKIDSFEKILIIE